MSLSTISQPHPIITTSLLDGKSPSTTTTTPLPSTARLTATFSSTSSTSSCTPSPSAIKYHDFSNARLDTSLYQTCLSLQYQLKQIPGLPSFWRASHQTTSLVLPISCLPDGMTVDPVTSIWTLFRQGSSLCCIFNAVGPPSRLEARPIDESDLKGKKRAVYSFVQACKSVLKLPDDQLFTVTDVFSDSTTDLLKIITTVKSVLEHAGIQPLKSPHPLLDNVKKDSYAKVVEELLLTERAYVNDLNRLQELMQKLKSSDLFSADTVHLMFPNLNTLVDFQRHFLIGVEANASFPRQNQRWGSLFMETEGRFSSAYEPFVLNQKHASDLVRIEAPKLSQIFNMLEPEYELPALLIKPIQRLCRYPLLLKELVKYATPSQYVVHERYDELLEGEAAIKRAAERVNETQRRADNIQVAQHLANNIDEWRNLPRSIIGDLLLSERLVMSHTDTDIGEYDIYLFERAILFCKSDSTIKSPKSTKKSRRSIVLDRRIPVNCIINAIMSPTDANTLVITWMEAYGHDNRNLRDIPSYQGIQGPNWESRRLRLRFRDERVLAQWQACLAELKMSALSNRKRNVSEPLLMRKVNDSPSSGFSHHPASEGYSSERKSYKERQTSSSFHSWQQQYNHKRQNSNNAQSTGFYPTPRSSDSSQLINEIPKNSSAGRSEDVSLSPSSSLCSLPSLTARLSVDACPDIKLKVIFPDGSSPAIISISLKTTFAELKERIERRARINGLPGFTRLYYEDEDGDLVMLGSDDDLQMAIESCYGEDPMVNFPDGNALVIRFAK